MENGIIMNKQKYLLLCFFILQSYILYIFFFLKKLLKATASRQISSFFVFFSQDYNIKNFDQMQVNENFKHYTVYIYS